MDYIKLTDGTQITIEDGASLDRIVHTSDGSADAVTVCTAVTSSGNLDRVEFWTEGAVEPYGVFEYLTNAAPPTRYDEGAEIKVVFSLREKTDIEKRLDALELSQEVQDEAIEDLGLAVSDIVEG